MRIAQSRIAAFSTRRLTFPCNQVLGSSVGSVPASKGRLVPEISRFLGIRIRMFREDHAPPHFHAIYGDREAVIEIETLQVVRGRVPTRVSRLILEWAVLHRTELRANWIRARSDARLLPIPPLE